MSVQVVGISGSPIPDSNTDLAVQRILVLTGLSSQFVKLSKLVPGPRNSCRTNDWRLRQADLSRRRMQPPASPPDLQKRLRSPVLSCRPGPTP